MTHAECGQSLPRWHTVLAWGRTLISLKFASPSVPASCKAQHSIFNRKGAHLQNKRRDEISRRVISLKIQGGRAVELRVRTGQQMGEHELQVERNDGDKIDPVHEV